MSLEHHVPAVAKFRFWLWSWTFERVHPGGCCALPLSFAVFQRGCNKMRLCALGAQWLVLVGVCTHLGAQPGFWSYLGAVLASLPREPEVDLIWNTHIAICVRAVCGSGTVCSLAHGLKIGVACCPVMGSAAPYVLPY